MNRHNITCIKNEKCLQIRYDSGIVSKAELVESTGRITFYFKDGQIVECDITAHVFAEIVYLGQFGISIADDGQYFFIQSWEKGLFCFKLQTGQLAWHCKRKRAFDLVIHKNHVVCHFQEQCVEVFEIDSGEILAHYPLGYATIFRALTDCLYLVGPKRGKYSVINYEMKELVRLPINLFNPHNYDCFLLNQAYLTTGGILISGFEYSTDADKRRRNAGENIHPEEYTFYRIVTADIPDASCQ